MLVEEIRRRIREAMKARDPTAKGILRVALGEIDSLAAARPRPVTDEEVASILRKLVKSNEETLAAAPREEQRETLAREIALLQDLLPKTLGAEEILEALRPLETALREAKSDGQAVGLAMKHLKEQGAPVQGKDVADVVRGLRA